MHFLSGASTLYLLVKICVLAKFAKYNDQFSFQKVGTSVSHFHVFADEANFACSPALYQPIKPFYTDISSEMDYKKRIHTIQLAVKGRGVEYFKVK